MSDYQLLTIGYTTLDRFLTLSPETARVITQDGEPFLTVPFGAKLPLESFHETLGGNSANVAVTSARLGIKTATWSVMGDDNIAHLAKRQFEKEGIGLDYFQTDPAIHSSVHTILSFQGERTIFSYGKQPDYKLPVLEPTPWVYLTSLLEGGDSIYDWLAKWVAEHKLNLVYQPGHVQLKIPPAQTTALLHATKIIIMNLEEAQGYTGLRRGDNGKEENLISLFKVLHSFGPEIVVITDGQNGAYASDGQKMYRQGVEDVSVVERTGAGDAYASAFCVALLHGKPVVEAMNWGLLNSQSVIQKVGPQAGILRLDQMQALLAEGRPKVEITSQPLHIGN